MFVKKIYFGCVLGLGILLLAACVPNETEPPAATTVGLITPIRPMTTTTTIVRPTLVPTNTATLKATIESTDVEEFPFPRPTNLVPRVTATPTPTPPLVEWPSLKHDIIFLADGSLKLWNHETEQLEILLASTAIDFEPYSYPPSSGIIYDYDVSADGKVVFAVATFAEFYDVTAGLYQLESWDSEPFLFNKLPTTNMIWDGQSSIYWAPDGSGVLGSVYIDQNEYTPVYVAVGESGYYDLGLAVGREISSISWLP